MHFSFSLSLGVHGNGVILVLCCQLPHQGTEPLLPCWEDAAEFILKWVKCFNSFCVNSMAYVELLCFIYILLISNSSEFALTDS